MDKDCKYAYFYKGFMAAYFK